jgi:hypothetical protein
MASNPSGSGPFGGACPACGYPAAVDAAVCPACYVQLASVPPPQPPQVQNSPGTDGFGARNPANLPLIVGSIMLVAVVLSIVLGRLIDPQAGVDDPPSLLVGTAAGQQGADGVTVPAQVPAPQARSGGGSLLIAPQETQRRLEREGAKTGDVQVSLVWDNYNDLDLHCIDPAGEEIFWRRRRSTSRGELDVDMNAGLGPFSAEPVENIYWPSGRAPRGAYRVFVNYFAFNGGADPTPYVVTLKVQGEVRHFSTRDPTSSRSLRSESDDP